MKKDIKLLIESFFDDIKFNIDSIPYDVLLKKYKQFEHLVIIPEGYGDVLFSLNEDLNYSEDIYDVKKNISKKYSLDDWQFIINAYANNINVAIVIPNIGENKENLINDMDKLGYFLNREGLHKKQNVTYVMLKFNPKYQEDIIDKIRSLPCIYHITPLYNLDDIKKHGIVPSYKNSIFIYPDRVYLLKIYDEKIIKSLIVQLCKANKDPRNNGEYVMLHINPKKLPRDIKFYDDPDYEYGIFAEQIIPYNAVEIETKINVNMNKL